jgi:RNA polymerase sigma-70 factor (ECF subfamily)
MNDAGRSPAEREQDSAPSETDLSAEDASRVKRGWSDRDPHDEDWLVEAARTDREAFGILYDRYFDAIYHYIARRVGDEQIAEDLSGAVWERALTAIERYELRGVPFSAWLYRIAGNQVANHHRKRKLWTLVPFAGQRGTTSGATRSDERTMVREALTQLSEGDQEVLSLCYYSGLTPPEIADVLGCSPAAVHKRLHRARARLRRLIEGDPRVSATTS